MSFFVSFQYIQHFISLLLPLNGYLPPDVAKSILHKVHTLLHIFSIKCMRILHKVHILQKVEGRSSRKKFNCTKFNCVQRGAGRVSIITISRAVSVCPSLCMFIITFFNSFRFYVYLLHMSKLLYCILVKDSIFGLVIS